MAGEIATAFVRIRPDSSGFKSETESGIVGAAKKIAATVGGIFAAEKLFDFGKEAVAGAASLQKSGEVISASFGKAGDTVKQFNETAAAQLGISAQVGESTAARFGILFKNLGIGKDKAAEMTVGFEKLTGSLSAIRGVDPTDVMNKIVLAAAGNTRGLKQLGIVVDSTAIKNEALKLGLIKTKKDAIDPATKAQAIYALATKNLGQFQQEAAAHSGDLTNVQMRLNAEWSNAKDTIGAALLPVVTRLATFFADILPPTLEGAQKVTGTVVAAIRGYFDDLKGAFDEAKGALQPLADAVGGWGNLLLPIAGAIGGIVAAFAAWKAITETWAAVTRIATAVQVAFNFVMTANPIGIVIVAVAALVGALIVLYTRSQTVRDIVNGTFTAIREVVTSVVTYLEGLWQRFGGTITSVAKTEFGFVRDYISSVLSTIKDVFQLFSDLIHGRWSKLWDDVKRIVSDVLAGIVAVLGATESIFLGLAERLGLAILHGILDGIHGLADDIGNLLNDIGKKIQSIATEAYGWALDMGKNIAKGVIDGLGSMLGQVKSTAESWAKKALGFLKHPWSILSPSKVTHDEIGVPIGQGIVEGFLLGVGNLPSKISQSVQTALDAARTKVQASQTLVSSAFQNLGQYAIKAFEGATSAELTKMGSEFNARIKTLVTDPMNAALARAASENKAALSQLDAQQATPTESESRLAALQAKHDEAARQAAITSARATLATDQAAGSTATPAQIKADQQALDDALYQETVSSLEKKAAAERTALDKSIATKRDAINQQYQDQQTGIQEAYAQLQAALTSQYNTRVLNYQSERDLQEQNLQGEIDSLGKSLALHPGLWQSEHDTIMKLFRESFGPDYVTAGKNLGTGFAKGIQQSFATVRKTAAQMAALLDSFLPHSPAKEGPLSRSPNWVGFLTDGLKPGLVAGALAAALALPGGVGRSALAAPDLIGALSPLGKMVDQNDEILGELRKQTQHLGSAASAAGPPVGAATTYVTPNAIAAGAIR